MFIEDVISDLSPPGVVWKSWYKTLEVA